MELVDESHLHVGHAGAADGKGHFRVRIVSNRFREIRPLQRQRMIFEALGDLMKTDIHALSVSAQPPAAGDGQLPADSPGNAAQSNSARHPAAGESGDN